MNTQAAKLTKEVMDRLPPAASGQYTVRDTEEPGFFVVVGARTKTFTVQVDVVDVLGKRATKKRAVGKWPQMGVAEARKAAREAKVALGREGVRPGGAALTLGDGWAELRATLLRDVEAGRRSMRTVETYDYGAKLLADWADTPLSRLSDNSPEVRRRHRDLTAARGPRAADFAMVTLRRVYNYARKRRLDPNLPHFNPVDSVDLNPNVRRDTAMGASELAGWHKKLRALPNPVRQEFHMFCLLSGSRAGALTVARWEHLDMKRRVLHIPKPKGGAKRAFDIPLSRPMLACLARARRAGRMVNAVNAAEWVFPGDLSRSHRPGFEGHIVEYREDRDDLPKWGGDLRQTYKTLSPEAGLSKTDVMILMNHADGDVNDGYMTRSKVAETYLRGQQEAMSRYIVGCMRRG
jgi:integrase